MSTFIVSVDIADRIGLVVLSIAAHISDPISQTCGEVVLSLFGLYLGWAILNIPHPSNLKSMTLKLKMTDEDGVASLLKQATSLRRLTIYDERNPTMVSEAFSFTSALQYFNPASFLILTSFIYRVEIGLFKMTSGATRIADPYNGLFADGPFSRLANLRTLEVSIHFSGSGHSKIDRKTFGLEWSALQNAIATSGRAITENIPPHPKNIRFLVSVKGYFDRTEGNRLKEVVAGYLFGLHFGALKAAGWKGEGTFDHQGGRGNLSAELLLQRADA
ncbi:hypothetical protein NMY22_g4899 [Coprinellus aureogranulatus]|nr:hypothetical protein NMY22_g4899 [Coprinellus aureogranulatus]